MRAGIAGGGIMGRLMAFSLVNAGWEVTLFDSGPSSNCSMAAAGLLTPVAELARLGKNPYFRQQGTLILAHPKDHADLTEFMRCIAHKINDEQYYRLLNQHDIIALEPELEKFHYAYHFPHEAQIDNQRLLKQLRQYLLQRNVRWHKNTVVADIQPGEIILESGVNKFDLVFDCRGLGAKNIFSDLRPIRGEIIWLQAPDVRINRPIRFLHPRYNLYLVPRPNGIYLIGASEIESQDTSAVSVRTALELLTAAYCINSKFAEARIIKTATQCRPALPDHLPRIQYEDKMIAINGLYRHGFLIAPTLVHHIMGEL